MKNKEIGYYGEKQTVSKYLVTNKVTKVLEDEIQHKCYIWFNNTYCLKNKDFRYLIFAVPNGGTRNLLEAKKMKNTGTLAGVSDLIVVLPQKVVFVEMKCEGGRLSDVQKDFRTRVNDLNHVYIVCYSLEEFQRKITAEMKRADLIDRVIKRLVKGRLMFRLFRKMLK